LASQAKGIQAILQERGLWDYYRAKQCKEGQAPLKLRCTHCIKSNAQKDAVERSERLVRQAKECGYFLPQEQSISELLSSDASLNDEINQPITELSPELSTSCCWSKIMASQSDFLNEQPLLQQIIKDAGHVCLFLPNFHCKLNPIELFWSYIKECKFQVITMSCFFYHANQLKFTCVTFSLPETIAHLQRFCGFQGII
jgi:hypothetical protein